MVISLGLLCLVQALVYHQSCIFWLVVFCQPVLFEQCWILMIVGSDFEWCCSDWCWFWFLKSRLLFLDEKLSTYNFLVLIFSFSFSCIDFLFSAAAKPWTGIVDWRSVRNSSHLYFRIRTIFRYSSTATALHSIDKCVFALRGVSFTHKRIFRRFHSDSGAHIH